MCTVYITITMIINHGAKQEFWWISQTLFLARFRNKPKHSTIQFQMWYFAFILLYTHSNLDIYHKCVPKIQFLCQFTFERLNESEIRFLFRFIYPFISSSFICFVTDILCSVILRSLTRQLQKMFWLLSTSLNFIRFIIYFNDLNPFNFELVINCSFIFDSDRVCVLYNIHRT